MKPVGVPPLGLTNHPRRDVLLLEAHFPDHPGTLDGYALRPVADWDALRERARTAPPSTVALVRTRGAAGELHELAALHRETPSIPIVAAVDFGAVDAARVRAVLAAGVAEIVNLGGMADLEAIVPVLRRAHAQPLKRRVEPGLPVWVPEDARTIIRAAAETVVDGGGREVLAGIFGIYERTLSTRCAELHLPPPRRLLGWMRVLHALTLLEEPGRTVMNVALSCGYNDNSSLKRAIENFTGTTPRPSIRHHPFADGFDRFAGELRALRHG